MREVTPHLLAQDSAILLGEIIDPMVQVIVKSEKLPFVPLAFGAG